MNDKMLVDTNILFYLVDKKEAEKHGLAKAWFASIAGKNNIFISMQNLREFSCIALKKTALPANEINYVLEMFANSFSLIFENPEDIAMANLLCKNSRKKFYDALLAATMQRHGIKVILTENTKDFKFRGIEAVNPLE